MFSLRPGKGYWISTLAALLMDLASVRLLSQVRLLADCSRKAKRKACCVTHRRCSIVPPVSCVPVAWPNIHPSARFAFCILKVHQKYAKLAPASAAAVAAEISRRKGLFKLFLFREPLFSFIIGRVVQKIQVRRTASLAPLRCRA